MPRTIQIGIGVAFAFYTISEVPWGLTILHGWWYPGARLNKSRGMRLAETRTTVLTSPDPAIVGELRRQHPAPRSTLQALSLIPHHPPPNPRLSSPSLFTTLHPTLDTSTPHSPPTSTQPPPPARRRDLGLQVARVINPLMAAMAIVFHVYTIAGELTALLNGSTETCDRYPTEIQSFLDGLNGLNGPDGLNGLNGPSSEAPAGLVPCLQDPLCPLRPLWRNVHVVCSLIHVLFALEMVAIVSMSGPWRRLSFAENMWLCRAMLVVQTLGIAIAHTLDVDDPR